MTTQETRWAALVARDSRADGRFVYGVRTTGVYCRPSCAARLARRENVRFFDTNHEAEAAGFRACLRCLPDGASLAERHAGKIAEVCRMIETAEEAPSLGAMAACAGLSAFHFHRVFRGATGVTPKQYAVAHRAGRVRDELRASATVTEAVYAAGYNSSSGFYASADAVLGMTPSAFRKGGDGAVIRFAHGECSLGAILVARSERGVCAILLGEDAEEDLRRRFPEATLIADDGQAVAAAIQMVEGAGADLPLDIRGTVFQQRVWKALQGIPAGSTASYTEIARRIGAPKSVRAVAGACAANALAVAIPCHRAVRSDGGLAGYRWGVERKRELLEREARE